MERVPQNRTGPEATSEADSEVSPEVSTQAGPASLGARCAMHPTVAAAATCGRCGTYICDGCVGFSGQAGAYCLSCAPRVQSVLVPWENEKLGFRRRLIDTVLLLVKEPARAFGQMAPGTAGPALLFAVFGGLLQGVVMAFLYGAVFGCMAGASALDSGFGEEAGITTAIAVAMVLGAPVMTMIVAVTYVLFIFAPYHLTARAFGGQGDASASLRAASYTQVLQLVLLPFIILQQIPLIGMVISMAVLSYVVGYISYALYHHALGIHRLEGGAAVAAAAAPAVVSLVFFGLFALALVILVVSTVGL